MVSIKTLLTGLLASALALAVLPAQAAIPAAERQVLINLYNGTSGDAWTNNSGWKTGGSFSPVGSECTWHGITCDAAQDHVTGVELSNNKLDGSLPVSLNELTALRAFDVTGNNLNGSIPALTGLTALQQFLVSNNNLNGPIPDLTGLTALWRFIVSSNNLSGPIPDLAGVPALWHFNVGNNNLSGSIPALAGLTLWQFVASNNDLNGPIPDLSGQTALEYFGVSNNNLSGPIPDLSGLTALEWFYVSNNQLTGTPPAAPASLQDARLCPNLLRTPSPTDTAWDTATGGTWSSGCTPGWLVDTNTGTGGSVAPEQQGVVNDDPATLTITPDTDYEIDTVGGTCSGTLTGDTYKTDPVSEDCTVQVSFKRTGDIAPIPTLGEWAMLLLAALLGMLGVRRLAVRRG